MAQVTREFILNQIEKLDYPYYTIYAMDGKTRIAQNINETDPTSAEARGQIMEAMENISGNVIIELKKSIKAGGDVRQMVTYQTNLAPANFGIKGIAPSTASGNTADIERLLQLQAENFQLQIKNIQEQHKRDLELADLKRQMADLKNSDFLERHGEKLIGYIPYILNGLAGKPTMPVAGPVVNGHPAEETTTATVEEATPEQQKLEELLRRMFAVDPDFLINLEKLVHLAEEKPEMYKMGLTTINSL